MTTILLVRHAHVAVPHNILIGRNDDVGISRKGLQGAAALAKHLQRLPIASVWSSPLRRAIQTASVIGSGVGLAVQIAASLNEVNYGLWTGCSFEQLSDDLEWRRFNTARSRAHVPAGETIKGVERRIAAQLESWNRDCPANYIVAVTHAEIIRIAILRTLGLSTDCYWQLEISPCSVSVLNQEGERSRILCINESGRLGCLKDL
jgi:broad specificity phosphatase PhoE